MQPISCEKAIDVALAENMDNLAATGQIDLGNIYLRRGDRVASCRTDPASRAGHGAQRPCAPDRGARSAGLVGLAVRAGSSGPAEARPLIEASLTFYQQAGYERESLQAAILLGGVLRQLGQNEDGIRILRDTLPGALRLQDRRLEALLRERIAENLRDQGEWPAAIAEYTKTGELYGAISQSEEARVQAAELSGASDAQRRRYACCVGHRSSRPRVKTRACSSPSHLREPRSHMLRAVLATRERLFDRHWQQPIKIVRPVGR